jgi:AmmeMemoRadiSam system protein B/AmmeMemoRadiSam system protein A
MLKAFVLVAAFAASVSLWGDSDILESRFAGSWYSSNPEVLKKQLEGFLANVKEKPTKENAAALILPHAGYRFSGQTAMFGIKQIMGRKYSRVIIIGPSHRASLPNCASLPNAKFYSTPLGKVPLDIEFIKKLSKSENFKILPQVHKYEHSVQMEIPLLQFGLKNLKIVPIVIGQLNSESAQKMAKILLSLIDDKTLLVISSDFTHYGSNYGYVPFKDNVKENLKKLDMGAYELIAQKDYKGFINYLDKTRATICGRNSIGILLCMLPSNARAKLLNYSTSAEMTGDFSNSVSYMSIMFEGEWKKGATSELDKEKKKEESKLTEEDKKNLLELARKTLTYFMKNGSMPTPDALDIKISDGMKQVMGAFVTLHKNGRLRGCIGEIVPRRELYKAVMAQAVNSGLRDYRFPQVQMNELPELEFEISALTPSKAVGSYKDIVIGKHGMTISMDGKRAIFLPQVAPEQGWDLAQTLTHLSMKAGLQPDAWKDKNAKFTVFEAIVFNEKDFDKKTKSK